MAVDTRNKRFSLIGFGRGIFGAAPNPDGSFAVAADRAQLAYLYPGIALAVIGGASAGRIRRARGKVYMPEVKSRGRL